MSFCSDRISSKCSWARLEVGAGAGAWLGVGAQASPGTQGGVQLVLRLGLESGPGLFLGRREVLENGCDEKIDDDVVREHVEDLGLGRGLELGLGLGQGLGQELRLGLGWQWA